MSALQTLIAAADGTTDEDAHVFVPVKAIRELQAWMPGERENLTTNGAAAWAGVDPQELRDGPEHVQRASLDADIRALAIDKAVAVISFGCAEVDERRYDTKVRWLPEPPEQKSRFDRALRVLRHFGMLIEHSDGVVSIKERT